MQWFCCKSYYVIKIYGPRVLSLGYSRFQFVAICNTKEHLVDGEKCLASLCIKVQTVEFCSFGKLWSSVFEVAFWVRNTRSSLWWANLSQFDHNTAYYSINNGHLQSFGSCDKDLTSNTCEWYLKTDKERQIPGLYSFIPAILHCLYWPRQLKNRFVPNVEIISSICGRKKYKSTFRFVVFHVLLFIYSSRGKF